MSYVKKCKTFKGVILDILVKIVQTRQGYIYILDIVTSGLILELNKLPSHYIRSTYCLSAKEYEVISAKIIKLLKKKVIAHSTKEHN